MNDNNGAGWLVAILILLWAWSQGLFGAQQPPAPGQGAAVATGDAAPLPTQQNQAPPVTLGPAPVTAPPAPTSPLPVAPVKGTAAPAPVSAASPEPLQANPQPVSTAVPVTRNPIFAPLVQKVTETKSTTSGVPAGAVGYVSHRETL